MESTSTTTTSTIPAAAAAPEVFDTERGLLATHGGDGGVADYYAIVGVGSTLTWKHTQQSKTNTVAAAAADVANNKNKNNKTNAIKPGTDTTDATSPQAVVLLSATPSNEKVTLNPSISSSSPKNTINDDDDDEVDPDELERFGREIVQIAIVVIVADDEEEETIPRGKNNSNKGDEPTSLVDPVAERTATTTSTSSRTSRDLRVEKQPPDPPNEMDDDHTTNKNNNDNGLWTVVRRSAAVPPANSGSAAATLSSPISSGQDWDANLDWYTGLRHAIAHWYHPSPQQQQHESLTISSSSSNIALNHNNDNGVPPTDVSSFATSTSALPSFRGLRNTVESKWKGLLLSHPHPNTNTKSNHSIQQQQQSNANDSNFLISTSSRSTPIIETVPLSSRPKQEQHHHRFYLSFQRRRQLQLEQDIATSSDLQKPMPSKKQQKSTAAAVPGLADVHLCYARLHPCLLDATHDVSLGRLATTTTIGDKARNNSETTTSMRAGSLAPLNEEDSLGKRVLLGDFLELPEAYDEWSIPQAYQWIRDPMTMNSVVNVSRQDRKSCFSMEVISDNCSPSCNTKLDDSSSSRDFSGDDDYRYSTELLLPRLVAVAGMPIGSTKTRNDAIICETDFIVIPILALRRQRYGEEERFHEDPAIVDVTVGFVDADGNTVIPTDSLSRYWENNDEDEDDYVDQDHEDDDTGTFRMLGKTSWTTSPCLVSTNRSGLSKYKNPIVGLPIVLVRRNMPSGFADVPFPTRVQGRFPFQNYQGLPLPEEELPMFCYPTGCRLVRTAFSDTPVPQYYGFVVKNERGDSIFVSCVSFMEPLTLDKVDQLGLVSTRRRRTSLPHMRFWEKLRSVNSPSYDNFNSNKGGHENRIDSSSEADNNVYLTAFDEMTTFENKTICLISRYPFWTAFRKFLSHLHIISGSSSDIPLERYISHLLLSVPLPRPGGPSILVPLPALNEPMILTLPPEKDLPLLNLPYHRLFACLDIKSIVTIVLGVLALERKIIVVSTRPSLVLDVCELLRSLLFPFELCAPYVPRLTEPFKSSLDFPGAIFVGIHDDGDASGLAALVKLTIPEESIVVDLDTGNMDCDGDMYQISSATWGVIPQTARSTLVSELKALCKDANIVDGREPLDSLLDSAFYVDLVDAVEGFDVSADSKESLDDRAVRDAFLRFFCSILGGYERFLLVPDADFLVSGNEWFDAQGFLASIPAGNTSYLTSLVSTQLFQSFIQRRTEASDVHCLLFDECIAEYHSSPVPYGRLGGDFEATRTESSSHPRLLYSLLVDQSAAVVSGYDPTTVTPNRSMDASDTDSSYSLFLSQLSSRAPDPTMREADFVINGAGDLVMRPLRQGLSKGQRFVYCVDGNPCFPHDFNVDLLLPSEPSSWVIVMGRAPDPLLARSERELEEANRRRRIATSFRGSNQRRCLWQLPKLMGSHFLGSWLICIPSLVSQTHLSYDRQSRYLFRALGALRALRSRQRIVPDEAAYRALMVACGRTKSDRRVELVKLFGLLRSDGIFPSAVTLGQYTKALAEGYSKRSSDNFHDEDYGLEVTASGSRLGLHVEVNGCDHKRIDLETTLYNLDPSLSALEAQGKRWRQRQSDERVLSADIGEDIASEARNRRMYPKTWLPVAYSTSFVTRSQESSHRNEGEINFVAMWSRTRGCSGCRYVPLDEEIQAGWDVSGRDTETAVAVRCPRCDTPMEPMLGYKEMSIEEASSIDYSSTEATEGTGDCTVKNESEILPPQIRSTIEPNSNIDNIAYVTYLNPATLRKSLEMHIEKHGELVLERDNLKELDPEAFYNFWWYCARFSLPLPLPSSPRAIHSCAFVAWDRDTAERYALWSSLSYWNIA